MQPRNSPRRRRAAVLGSPIEHSLSPVLHRAAYAQLGMDWTYEAVDVTESDLADFIQSCGSEWAGLSLTMPLKKAVLPLLDRISDTASVVGAVNTVVFDADGLAGHNTDVHGIAAALGGAGAQLGCDAVVLGSGATAASALAALAQMQCSAVHVLARRPEVARAQLIPVAERLSVALEVDLLPNPLPSLPEAHVVIKALPVEVALDHVPNRPGVLLDVSYSPWPPRLVSQWRTAGGVAVSGDEMLLHQAARQVQLMCGNTPNLDTMRTALRASLL